MASHSTGTYVDDGHTVIAVPVPALEQFVRARTRFYDASYESPDPQFGQAHVTLLAPWKREPMPDDLAVIGQIVADVEPFSYTLGQFGTFPDGIIYVRPSPEHPFTAMTCAIEAAFADYPAYGGKFDDVVAHVTLDAHGEFTATAADGGPVTQEWVQRQVWSACAGQHWALDVQLQWWQSGNCHVMHQWTLGGDA